ncbi:MAG: hypothetical protein R2709_15600 [Marmoricola sp.]
MSDSSLPAARPHTKYTEEGRRMREVLTYSRRGSRFTPSQQESWDAHQHKWVIDEAQVDQPDFSLSTAFGRQAPLIVEIGSGIGEATAALAAARPEVNVLAFEVWAPGVAHTLGLLGEAGAENVRLVSVDAVWAMQHLIGEGELEELWTFFPDPWPRSVTTNAVWSPPTSSDSSRHACARRRLAPGHRLGGVRRADVCRTRC